jgi:hypothetical protein
VGSLSVAFTSTIAWIPLLLLFFRMPPVVYSLTLVPLPEALEAALYAPAFLYVPALVVLALLAFWRARREPQAAKGYPPSGSLGEGRSP